jgi:hypothetical protein
MCHGFQFCTHQKVCVLHFLKKGKFVLPYCRPRTTDFFYSILSCDQKLTAKQIIGRLVYLMKYLSVLFQRPLNFLLFVWVYRHLCRFFQILSAYLLTFKTPLPPPPTLPRTHTYCNVELYPLYMYIKSGTVHVERAHHSFIVLLKD